MRNSTPAKMPDLWILNCVQKKCRKTFFSISGQCNPSHLQYLMQSGGKKTRNSSSVVLFWLPTFDFFSWFFIEILLAQD